MSMMSNSLQPSGPYEVRYSKHALVRQQQRSIPPLIVQWLLDYGEEHHDHHGAIKRYFSKQSLKRLKRIFGKRAVMKMSENFSAYAVEKNGRVLTIGYCIKHLNRH
jgi:hypothetical protein